MKTHIYIAFAACLALLLSGSTSPRELQRSDDNPEDSLLYFFKNPDSESRAFVRWWWNGNRVDEKEVLRELNLLKDAGFGGVEINPIAMPPVTGEPDQRQLEWLSPEWMQVLKTACLGAKERGMMADLLVGSGWPFGGKFLKPDQTIERMAINYRDIKGPQVLSYKIKDLEDDLPGEYMRGQLEKDSKRTLTFLRLIPDNINSVDQVIDLFPYFKNDEVSYNVPEGSYRLAWGVLQKGYREVVHGTLGAEGPTMDHFNADVVKAFLNRLLEIEKELGIPLNQLVRALFADSMELAGSNWCSDLREEFEKRCGYSIDPYLPFILYYSRDPYPYEIDDPGFKDMVERVTYDYTRTLVDLFHERFTMTFQKFCTDHDIKCRYQAYGSPWLIGMLDGYMIVDIPESNNWFYSQGTKPDDEDYFTWSKNHGYMIWNKYASSGGHLTGKNIISCEAMTNLGGVFQASLSTIKQAGDMNFITGITHSVLHGFNYSPPEAGFPGWVRYGTFFSEHNTLWPHFKNWLDYDARVSSVLQNSDPVVDIAILPPEADKWSMHGLIRQPFHTEPWYVFELWQGISQNGSSCDYLNERVIQQSGIKKGKMIFGPMSYKTLILADIKSLEPETAEAVFKFVKKGGRLICIGHDVERASSLSGYENEGEILSLFSKMKAYKDRVYYTEAPIEGTDITAWIKEVFERSGHIPDIRINNPDRSLYQIHHRYMDKDVYFISNTNRKKTIDNVLNLNLNGKSVWKWDPERGDREPMVAENNEIKISLQPLESFLLVVEPGKAAGPVIKDYDSKMNPEPFTIKSDWQARFYPVNGDEFSRSFTSLIDLSESSDTMLQNFAGEVIYTANFDSRETHFKYLDLGEINEGVTEVSINGMRLGKKWYGRHVYEIDEQLRLGSNEIEIVYTSLLSNYCKSLYNIEAKRWIGDRELIPNGLEGPVVFK
jgi:hypothetical protein